MLGHRWRDTKILLNGQAHFDHAAGTAQIVRETGAKVMVMEGDADVIESGGKADFAHLPEFPPAHVDRVLHDGDTVAFGGVTLKAIKTAGHTRGCTTWVTDVRDTAGRKRSVVIVGGLTALDTYRLIPSRAGNESYPGIAADFQHTFQTLNALRPDIFLGAHGSYFGMQKKLAERRDDNDTSVWIDPVGFHRAVEEAWRDFEKHLRSEQRADTTRMSRH